MKRNGWEKNESANRRPTLHFAGSFNARGHLNELQRQPSCKLQPNHCTTTQKTTTKYKKFRGRRGENKVKKKVEKNPGGKLCGKQKHKPLEQTQVAATWALQLTGGLQLQLQLATSTHTHTQKFLKGLNTYIF